MRILVTGGTGYIGSHTCIELLDAGYEVLIIDNLSNSKFEVVDKIKKISNKDVAFYEADICDEKKLHEIFEGNNIEAVIHFAGLKAVGESVKKPIEYYENNVAGTLTLLKAMQINNVKKMVFSSSATVYGMTEKIPVTEEVDLSAFNPYGRTKLMIEEILRDVYTSDNTWSISLLRYFNPIGAHESGLIGEEPNGVPNNLMPYIAQVAAGIRKELNVFGNDYPTKDGTGVRDYIHVMDLAKGHIKALGKIINSTGVQAYNLGTGKGYSVLDVISTFEKVTQQQVPFKIVGRREGDVPILYADPSKAINELHWKAEKDLETMCRDTWNFIITKK